MTLSKFSLLGIWVCTLAMLPAEMRAQFIQQGNKLVATGTSFTQQGRSVALSNDGNTAIVGGPLDAGGTGGAWVYTRTSGVWGQQGGKLLGTGTYFGIGVNQGYAVSISADGNTALVSSYADSNNTGAIWLFTRSGSVWSQQGAKLVGTGSSGTPYQGFSAALSSDGNTAIVGGYWDNNFAGAAWVFVRVGSTWSQQGSKLVGSGGSANAEQGYSVALSSDGNTAIVGGPNDNSGVGAAWVYTRTNRVWTQQGTKLIGAGGVGNQSQGWSVALSADGNTALVGGSDDNSFAGAGWVFTRTANVWSQQGNKLVGTGAAGIAHQATSVSLAADGNTAMLGGSDDNNFAGASWIFTRAGSVWSQFGSKLVGSGAVGTNVRQGISVGLSGDGSTAIVGGFADNSFAGAAWVFARGSTNVNALPDGMPSSYIIEQNYPNPFNPTTTIKFQIPNANHVTLKVFDLLGRGVATLVNEVKSPGTYRLTWDASGMASGVYFYRLTAGNFVQTRKLSLLR
jgi:lipocalin